MELEEFYKQVGGNEWLMIIMKHQELIFDGKN